MGSRSSARRPPLRSICTIAAGIARVVSASDTLAELVDRIPDEVPAILKMNISDPGRFADLAATNMNFRIADKDEVLQKLDIGQRLTFILSRLERELATPMTSGVAHPARAPPPRSAPRRARPVRAVSRSASSPPCGAGLSSEARRRPS